MNPELSPYERLQLLYEAGKQLHATLDPQEALERIVREAVRILGASSGSVALLNPTTGRLEIQASHGLPEGAADFRLRPGEGITGLVASTGKPARVDDVRADPKYVQIRPEARSELAVPLELAGDVRGVLNVDADRPGAFSAADQELLEALAQEAATVIHNTWLHEQLRLKARLLESLIRVSQAINSAVHLGEALECITREAAGLARAKLCSLMLLDPSGQWLEVRASFGAGPRYLQKPPLNVDESFVGVAVRRQKPMQLENVQTSAQYQHTLIAREEGIVSLLAVPLVFSGRSIGVLNVYTGSRYSFSNEEVRIISALADLSALAIEKARLYERVVDIEEQLRRNEKLSALGLLAAEVAHEIRNPLTVMKMLYHSLDLRFPEGDPRTRDARVLGEKIDQLNSIVDRILVFARTAEPQISSVDINERIGEVVLLVRHKLRQQRVRLFEELQPNLPKVAGDAAQLDQSLLNLILNASEAMPTGGELRISTQPAEVEGVAGIQIEIADTGSGMSTAQQDRAFSPMLGTSKARGTGLGLAIVARVIESHRGKISIESAVGHGTKVRICLPGES